MKIFYKPRFKMSRQEYQRLISGLPDRLYVPEAMRLLNLTRMQIGTLRKYGALPNFEHNDKRMIYCTKEEFLTALKENVEFV